MVCGCFLESRTQQRHRSVFGEHRMRNVSIHICSGQVEIGWGLPSIVSRGASRNAYATCWWISRVRYMLLFIFLVAMWDFAEGYPNKWFVVASWNPELSKCIYKVSENLQCSIHVHFMCLMARLEVAGGYPNNGLWLRLGIQNSTNACYVFLWISNARYMFLFICSLAWLEFAGGCHKELFVVGVVVS